MAQESTVNVLSFEWEHFVFCKNCNAVFSFEYAQNQPSFVSRVTFPNHDFLTVFAYCPYCDMGYDYTGADWKAYANSPKDEISGLKKEIKALLSEKEGMNNKVKEQDI